MEKLLMVVLSAEAILLGLRLTGVIQWGIVMMLSPIWITGIVMYGGLILGLLLWLIAMMMSKE